MSEADKQNETVQQKHEEYIVAFFKKVAVFYDLGEFMLRPIRKKVTSKISQKNAKIADFACGTGSQSLAFAREGHTVTGIDLSPDMLARARKKIKPQYAVQFIEKNVIDTGLKDGEFDVASINFALHEMPEEIVLKTLQEMKRVTKKGGQILIAEYNTPRNWFGSSFARIYESIYFYPFIKKGLAYYLEKADLKPVSKEVIYFNIIQVVKCINE